MNRRKLSCIIVAMALVTALALPGPASAAPRGHVPGADAWAWFSRLWSRAVAVLVPGDGGSQKQGYGIDPNGSDQGYGIDPNGTTTTDQGHGIDPNG
ncbi:MAG: hypothetical protein ACJ75H_06095 [Thermoanaerobaculia bacterium]